MSERISQLPDDILCCIFSLLTLRDAARTKSLINRWRILPDIRSTLLFDTFNVFGKETKCCYTDENRSKFVAVVDQCMEQWRGTRISKLHINFDLGLEDANHIDGWIATAIRMGVDDVHLNFIHTKANRKSYSFPTNTLKSSSLKCLHLQNCKLHGSSIWFSQLTELSLSHVPLGQIGVQSILSNALNLTSLALADCCLPRVILIRGQPPLLKKLAIEESVITIELNCVNLESFRFYGDSGKLIFAHVPSLKYVDILLRFSVLSCSYIFDDLIRNALQLESLSLSMKINALPPVFGNFRRSCLRKLNLHARIPLGFNVSNFFYILYVFPSLEILHLKFSVRAHTIRGQQRIYGHSSAIQLKEVQIEGFQFRLNEFWFVVDLLKKARNLQHMIFKTSYNISVPQRRLLSSLQKFNTSAKVIIV